MYILSHYTESSLKPSHRAPIPLREGHRLKGGMTQRLNPESPQARRVVACCCPIRRTLCNTRTAIPEYMRFEKTSSTFFFLRQTVTCVCTTFFCSPQQDDPAAFFRKPPTDRLLDIARPLERLSRRKGCDTVRSRSPTRGRRPPTWGRGSNLVARLVGDVNRVLSLNAVVSVVIGG